MEQEIWKSIPGYEGFYEASTLGRIRSVDRVVAHSSGNGQSFRKGRILHHNSMDDYQFVILSKRGKKAQLAVHRLVALTFLPNPDNLPIVNHKDLNTHNNAANNLEWATQQYNCIHAIQNNHKPTLSAEARQRVTDAAKKKNSKPIMCLTTNEIFNSVTDAANHFNISFDTVLLSAKKHQPTRKGLEFRYKITEVIK